VTDDPANLDFPFATEEVKISAAYTSSLKLHQNFLARNFRFWDIFNLQIAWTTINSRFQNRSAFEILDCADY
jgi:hypothetical protein